MTTLEHLQQSDLLPMELPLTSSAEDSHAKTLAQREKAQGLQANAADYGAKLPVLLASYDHPTSSWRTFQHYLDEGLERFSETWPRSGMMRSGTAYQLPTLAHRIDGTASGSLPMWTTPSASDATRGGTITANMTGTSLAQQVNTPQYWPTPKATLRGDCPSERRRRTPDLAAAVKMWPTPQASDNRDRGNLSSGAVKRRMEKGKQISLSQSVSEVSGQLNPTWVEWLMGFPTGHTDLKG
jgi:hypothetical protein